MAFVSGTPVLTNSGWKNIEDISGRDKVLVRNFIGYAEFIQPFALKTKQYNGEIVKIGAKNWLFSVTPEHIVVYDRNNTPTGSNFVFEEAQYVKVSPYNRIYRKFKYMPSEEYKKETIVINSVFGKQWVTISNQDWFVLIGYVLCRGIFKNAGPRKKALSIYLDREQREKEIALLGDILNRIGVTWSLIPSYTDDRWSIRVDTKNTLASKIIARLGSSKRKEMFLSNTIIYNSSKELAKTLIETIVTATKKVTTDRGKLYQLSTNNEKLIESLAILGTLCGYGMQSMVAAKKGTTVTRGPLRKDVMRLTMRNLSETYSPRYIEKYNYKGYVYEIDLFDGQVYVKEGVVPVWVNPK